MSEFPPRPTPSRIRVPLPIAQRTHRYIAGCGLPPLELGRPTTAQEQQS